MTHGKKWWVIFRNDGSKHIKLTTVDIWLVYFTYTLTQTLVCIYTEQQKKRIFCIFGTVYILGFKYLSNDM